MNVAAAAGQAQSDSVPLLVISPGMPRAHPRASTGYLHEMPSQQRALSGVVERSVRVMSHAELARELADAFAAFRSQRPRARHIEVPLDLLAEAPRTRCPSSAHRAAEAGARRDRRRGRAAARGGAPGDRRRRRRGRRGRRLGALAERLGAPVLTTANGKGRCPRTTRSRSARG